MLEPIWMGSNIAAGNQQKHVSLSFATKEWIYLSGQFCPPFLLFNQWYFTSLSEAEMKSNREIMAGSPSGKEVILARMCVKVEVNMDETGILLSWTQLPTHSRRKQILQNYIPTDGDKDGDSQVFKVFEIVTVHYFYLYKEINFHEKRSTAIRQLQFPREHQCVNKLA